MPSELAMQIAERVLVRFTDKSSLKAHAADIIDAEIAPLLEENERLKADLKDSQHWQRRHCEESAANGVQSVEHWKQLQAAASDNAALRKRVAELEADAERYRKLRNRDIGWPIWTRQSTPH